MTLIRLRESEEKPRIKVVVIASVGDMTSLSHRLESILTCKKILISPAKDSGMFHILVETELSFAEFSLWATRGKKSKTKVRLLDEYIKNLKESEIDKQFDEVSDLILAEKEIKEREAKANKYTIELKVKTKALKVEKAEAKNVRRSEILRKLTEADEKLLVQNNQGRVKVSLTDVFSENGGLVESLFSGVSKVLLSKNQYIFDKRIREVREVILGTPWAVFIVKELTKTLVDAESLERIVVSRKNLLRKQNE